MKVSIVALVLVAALATIVHAQEDNDNSGDDFETGEHYEGADEVNPSGNYDAGEQRESTEEVYPGGEYDPSEQYASTDEADPNGEYHASEQQTGTDEYPSGDYEAGEQYARTEGEAEGSDDNDYNEYFSQYGSPSNDQAEAWPVQASSNNQDQQYQQSSTPNSNAAQVAPPPAKNNGQQPAPMAPVSYSGYRYPGSIFSTPKEAQQPKPSKSIFSRMSNLVKDPCKAQGTISRFCRRWTIVVLHSVLPCRHSTLRSTSPYSNQSMQ